MSFFNWFSGKPTQAKLTANEAPGRLPAGRDKPVAAAPQRLLPETVMRGGGGRLKRHARREQLYVAIREAMTRAGVLSASYKFKVLSLDQPGNEFLVMLDLLKPPEDLPEQIAGIELLIVHNAKARFEITVPAVYWRIDAEPTEKPLPGPQAAAQQAARLGGDAVAAARAALRLAQPGAARYEPIEADEVAAFKQALQVASPKSASVAAVQGVKTRTGLRSYTLLTGFEETEMSMADSFPALSTTQYGELT
ncbi:MAG: hypothetical protein ACYCZ6_04305 [Polaromonas sp.]